MWKAIVIIVVLLVIVFSASKAIIKYGILHKNPKDKK